MTRPKKDQTPDASEYLTGRYPDLFKAPNPEDADVDARKGAGHYVGSAAGLVPAIAGFVPSLVKNQGERKALKRIQEHGGLGKTAALQAGAQAAREARSIAAGATGPSKAFATRAAIQGAQEAQRQAAATGARAGILEQQGATEQLSALDQARRANIAKFGATLGAGAAQMYAQNLATKDTEAERARERARRDEEAAAKKDELDAKYGTGPVEQVQWQTPEGPEFGARETYYDPEGTLQTYSPNLDTLEAYGTSDDNVAAAAQEKPTTHPLIAEYERTMSQVSTHRRSPIYRQMVMGGMSDAAALQAIAPGLLARGTRLSQALQGGDLTGAK